jgi:hypothetical protein
MGLVLLDIHLSLPNRLTSNPCFSSMCVPCHLCVCSRDPELAADIERYSNQMKNLSLSAALKNRAKASEEFPEPGEGKTRQLH